MTTRHITVTGKWPFPTAMLRHARPATAKDHALIALLSGASADPDLRRQTIAIDLVADGDPRDARWRDFGWRIVGDPAIERAREQEAQAALRRSALRKLTLAEQQALGC